MLFIIYFNDALLEFKCPIFVYADDLKVAKTITTLDDCYSLQNDLNNFIIWCHNNKQNINVAKCKVITFSRSPDTTQYKYELNDTEIDRVFQIKDLGVVVDSKLSFIPHFQHICDHANRMLGFIIRNTVGFTNVDSLLVLYYSFIRSKLEYSSVVWDPYYKIHISSIERIQRKFCKHLFYVKFGRYPVRTCSSVILFNEFNLYSLKDRRTVANIFLHKLIHGKIFSQNLLANLRFHIPRLNCRYTGTFAIDWCRTNQHF
ncbi:hypothetical protein, partial [Enterobacter cloacae complex sp. 2DZ2F20B]|uniref:hypothetical protein n=1 Tax=Enterobacter cloacae complex sp. 2DZ2F20B TaxID=2511993 RepID=UPI0021034BE7